jgi:ATP-binding cassette subfamily B protein
MRAKMSYLNRKNFTETINNINMDINNISMITDDSFVLRILRIFKIVGGFIGLLTINHKLTFLIIFFIPMRYFLTCFFSKTKKEYFKEYMEHARKYSSWYGDRMSGIKEIKTSGIEAVIKRQFKNIQRKIIKTNIKIRTLDRINGISESIMFTLVTTLIYIIGAFAVINNSLTVGGIFAFSMYSMRVLIPISSLIKLKYDFVSVLASAERLFRFFDMDYEKDERNTIRFDESSIKGNITFHKVSFSYDSSNKVLKNVSFKIKKGEKVGIVGPNGSGKTTIINLLLKFYQPESGQVYIDDVDINNLSIKDLRKGISIVNQDTYLFNESIMDNISLFSNIDNDRITEVLVNSCSYEFVEELDKGLKTKVGVKGSKLSGGQKQRIALARALAKSANIFIFDEATSNFDLASQITVNNYILEYLDEKTIIFITHRPYILKELDKIIVIDRGNIIDIGKHYELIGRCIMYKKIIKAESK